MDSEVYIFLNTLWPSVRDCGTLKQYCYQHIGAPCDVAKLLLDFVQSKFANRSLSRNLGYKWPVNSLNLRRFEFFGFMLLVK